MITEHTHYMSTNVRHSPPGLEKVKVIDISCFPSLSPLPPLPPLPSSSVETTVPIHSFFKKKKVKKKQSPIVSCGVICFNTLGDERKSLLIRRKDSLGFVEFVRGKYKPTDPHYIRELVDSMTYTERKRILDNEFQFLWRNMWISKSYRRHRPEYQKSLSRFESIKDSIREYIKNNPEKGWEEPEWGFPKGRPNRGESDIDCARREFREETGISEDDLRILPKEYKEVYTGTNGIVYENRYFIGICNQMDVYMDPSNRLQKKEVSDIRWFLIKNVSKIIRNTYPSRKNIYDSASKWFLDEYD